MIEVLAPAIRIMVLWAFTRFVTLGYLTPENASDLTKTFMDVLMYGAPVIYATWASFKSTLRARIAAIVKSRRVRAVKVTDPELATLRSDKVQM